MIYIFIYSRYRIQKLVALQYSNIFANDYINYFQILQNLLIKIEKRYAISEEYLTEE